MAELKTQNGLIVGMIPENYQEKPKKDEPTPEDAPVKTRKPRSKE